jgi:hypothetical protein
MLVLVTPFDDGDPFFFGPVGRRVAGAGLALLMVYAFWDAIRRR